MNYEFFLNKEDSRTYIFLKYLQSSHTMSASWIELQEDLNLSVFLLDKTLMKLQEDINRFKMNQHIKLIIGDSNISIETDSHYSGKLLKWKYISESLSLEMILAIFKGEFRSIEQFSEENHISYSVAYKTLQSLKRALKPYQIMIRKGEFCGNNLHVFLFLTELFPMSTIAVERIYSKSTLMKADKLIQFVLNEYSLTKYEVSFFFHYIAVALEKSIDFSDFFSADIFSFFEECTTKIFKQNKDESEEHLLFEICIWLFMNKKLELNDTHLQEIKSISELNQLFCNSLTSHFKGVDLAVYEQMIDRLTIIHFGIYYFPVSLFREVEINIDFFQQNFPEYYRFLLNYVNQLGKVYPQLKRFQSYLFFQYLLLLINYIPIEKLEDPVKILLDFSLGELYNSFIERNLLFFINLNIQMIKASDTYCPDIIITNINRLYENEQSRVMVWLDPPQTHDWVNLTNIILEVKQNRQS